VQSVRALLRDGSITLAALIDAYFREYSGRDSTRPQRLGWWRERFGHLPLAELEDDHVFEAMEALAQRRGAYFAGKDVEGKKIMRVKTKALSPATLNRYQAAYSAVLIWARLPRPFEFWRGFPSRATRRSRAATPSAADASWGSDLAVT